MMLLRTGDEEVWDTETEEGHDDVDEETAEGVAAVGADVGFGRVGGEGFVGAEVLLAPLDCGGGGLWVRR